MSDKILTDAKRDALSFNAEDAEDFAKGTERLPLRSSANTFVTSAFEGGVLAVAVLPRWVNLSPSVVSLPETES